MVSLIARSVAHWLLEKQPRKTANATFGSASGFEVWQGRQARRIWAAVWPSSRTAEADRVRPSASQPATPHRTARTGSTISLACWVGTDPAVTNTAGVSVTVDLPAAALARLQAEAAKRRLSIDEVIAELAA